PHTVRTLGGALAPEPETRLDELAPRDVLLFCTDAVVRALGPAGVGAVLRRESSPVETCDELVRAARERGLADDATAVVVRCFALRPQDDEPPLPAA
ncbi:MAG TPA: SpoIIE family protein phosphatase, partial [Sandaracinaceae bacterium]